MSGFGSFTNAAGRKDMQTRIRHLRLSGEKAIKAKLSAQVYIRPVKQVVRKTSFDQTPKVSWGTRGKENNSARNQDFGVRHESDLNPKPYKP